MKIQMLQTRRGSENGHIVRQFVAGESYDVADTLARQFINQGYAKDLDTRSRDEVFQDFLNRIEAA